MIKDIVVNLSVAPIHDVAGDFAVSIAAAFNAHVTGIAFVYEPAPAALVMGSIPAEVIAGLRRESEEAAKAATARFDRLATRMGLSAESRTVDATFLGAADSFGRIARRFDLSVVGQAEPGKLVAEELIVEAALFASGRPVVIVPYIQKGALRLDRVMICWDGSRNAARAVADAMPFLVRAKAVNIVIVAAAPAPGNGVPGADIAQHLARHGLHVEVQHIVSPDLDVANTILSQAADSAADFLVMGGYGHSRLREIVLGGATRGILSAMTVPTLMSH